MSGTPDGRCAFPLEPLVQGRYVRIASAEAFSSASPDTPRVNPSPDRATLRAALRERRRALTAAQRIAAAEALAERILELPFFPQHGCVAGYWAVDGEIGLHVLQLHLPPTLTYCLPVLHADGSLRFAEWRTGAPLVENRFGIPEPDVAPEACRSAAELSLLLVPLTGFDAAGNRLGMGGGWYDRSLAFRRERPAPPWLVGAAYATQCTEQIPVEPWDVRLDAICSEDATWIAEEPQ